jgi:hypothetical protein
VTARPRNADALDAALSIEPGRLSSLLDRSRDRATATRDAGAEDGAFAPPSVARPRSPAVPSPTLTRAQLAYAAARAEGYNQLQAAERAGVTARAVRKWRRKPGLAAALEAHTDELAAAVVVAARRVVQAASERTARRLVQLARSEDEETARKAAVDVLKLAGLEAAGPRRQGDGGPRIVIERAVLALTSDPGTDPGTPQDGG